MQSAKAVASERIVATLLVHNGSETVERVARAILEQTVRPHALVVVDNGSSDDSTDRIERVITSDSEPLELEVIRLDHNLGVGAGHNTAWRRALSEYAPTRLWVLEHDSVPLPNCLEELLAASSISPEPLIVFPRMERDEYELATEVPPRARARFTLNGPLIPATVIEQIGFLREDFFVGQEDWDYSARARDLGIGCLRSDRTAVLHGTKGDHRYGIKASPDRLYYSARNLAYRQSQLRTRRPTTLVRLGAKAFGAAAWELVRHGSPRRAVARWQGFVDGVTGQLGPRSRNSRRSRSRA